MPKLDLPPIAVDFEALRLTDDRWDFDLLGFEMLARAGRMAEQVGAGVARATPPTGLTLDEAVVGGLLIRLTKLVRALFDSTQADQSEAHLALSRCVAETALTLRWLVEHGTAEHLRRFRADSFAQWRRELARMQQVGSGSEDDVQRLTRQKVEEQVGHELLAAGLSWDDVPAIPNSWGPDLRQRCQAFDQEWIYHSLFASHSAYVHPSWHEIRAFHLATDGEALVLDMTYGGMAPGVGYVVSRLVAEACGATARFLPCDLEPEDVRERVEATVQAGQMLASEFAEFMARGGVDDDLKRHRD